MAEGRRVLITGVANFLGLRLAKRLEHADDIESLVGVDLEEPPVPIRKLDFIRADLRSPLMLRILERMEIDTIVHTNITSMPRRLGGRSKMKEHNVMGTLQLMAAAQRHDALKKLVMKSSAAVYGYSPRLPSILAEDQTGRYGRLTGYAKDCADAETYARDFGRRRRDVDLVILRTQNVIGPTVRTNITDYLSLPVVPTALGYDPRLQLLHEEDAVEALVQALTTDCRGIFNVAANGVTYLSQAIRLLGKAEVPIPTTGAQVAAMMLRTLGVVDFPSDQLKLIVYGRVVDTRRAKEAFGFSPRYTTKAALEDFRDNREQLRGGPRPDWERDLAGLGPPRERAG